ncbi:cation:H+ antiporter [Desulfacinum hydrothermale DSM 13146]|uniref:Cation:H+ antiporter n=1 Tax=Desulfacinum hydrothermale DSM 13146 TaxID=1121390 RepID=A0A1W1XUZ9_9BACT|nr:calcium/sodium antiporter [Desulfacinum hydrothermale]SMC27726.1 cation:H+ antiporter [Desulfacinum hydrothermale DSM 13146]
MILYGAAALAGICGLMWGADRFVEGAARLARRLGISPLIVGLTVVSFGTSLPELLIAVTATFMGHPDVAVGNVVGSNVANICLILGTASLFRPLLIQSSLIHREYPALVAVSVLAWLMAKDGVFSRFEGLILLGAMALFLGWMVQSAKQGHVDKLVSEASETPEPAQKEGLGRPVTYLVMGLVCLSVGSRLLVWGGVGMARAFGVSELVIGLTLVALGTSLPELATSVAGAIKKEDDIAVGNVVGSNLFNTLAILGIPATLVPLRVSSEAFHRDFPVMLLATFLLWPVCRSWKAGRQGRVNRLEGGALAAGYLAYMTYLFVH